MKATTSVWFAILAAAVAAAAARGAESGEFRVDARPSYGGRVGTGVEWVGEADGSALRQWDTTALPDGWTTLESGGGAAEVCVLNGPDVAGGRVDSDETWGADRVHVVRDDVVVGEGAVLTLERGAVVKFTEGARIVVEEGGDVVARGAYLADAADDSVGGDTNLDGGDTLPGAVEWWLEDEVVGGLIGVSFVGGGTDLPKRTYSAGETYGALPEPEDEAAIFGGWFTKPGGDGARVSPSTRVNARVTALYAKWTPYSVGVEPMSVAAAPTGGTYRVAVSANTAWSAAAGADWLRLGSAGGEGDGELAISADANENTSARAATVRVQLSRGGAFRDVTVTQEGMEQVAAPDIRPVDGTTFEGTSQRVVMDCPTAGARILYTLDGSEPTEGGIPYAGSFNVFDTTVVKAKAFKEGMIRSATASARLVRLLTLAEAIDQPLWTVATDAEHPWKVVDAPAHDGEHAARSGAVGLEQSTRMETTVDGEGWLGFWWKVSCEDDPDGTGWDRLSFYLDGRLVDSIDGERDWAEVGVKVRGAGIHTLAWTYSKDWFDETPTEDCGWVDQVTWNPTVTDEDVPLSWLADLGLVDAGMSNETAAALDVDGDGLTAAQEYLAGTDPTDADSVLLTGLRFPGGTPEVTWTPDLESDRDYRVLAKKAMTDPDWTDVTDLDDCSAYHFFTVEVRPVE